jgi:hypothetical protein
MDGCVLEERGVAVVIRVYKEEKQRVVKTMEVLIYYIASSRNEYQGSSSGKGLPAHKSDNLTAVYEPTAKNMLKPRRLTILWTSAACYRDSVTFLTFLRIMCSCKCYSKKISGRINAVTELAEALCYKPEGCGRDTR